MRIRGKTKRLFLLRAGITSAFLLLAVSVARGEKPDTALGKVDAEEWVRQSGQHVVAINETIMRTSAELEKARITSDDERLRCIRDKWIAMKGLLKMSSQALESLRETVVAEDRGGAEHEKTKIDIAYAKTVELEAHVQACGGSVTDEDGDGNIVIEQLFDDDLPETDPVQEFRLRDVDLIRPTAATQVF